MAKKKTHEEFVEEVKRANPNIIISGKYENNLSKIKCECKVCHYVWMSVARNLTKPTQCLNCFHQKRTFVYPNISNEDFCKIVKDFYPDLEITGTYSRNLKMITCLCHACNYRSRVRTQMLLEKTYECPICKNGKENIKYGINDIKTVNPVLYECLKDKSDAEKYTIYSRAKVDFICPCCHAVIKNKSIGHVNTRGLKCKCQDGNSLGEKYFYQVIKSLDNNVEVEKYINNNLKYRYDFYGDFNGVKWICEIMGKQHSIKSFETCGGRTLAEEIENDRCKKEYALSQGVDLYVEIDSKESGFNQLKSAIINSDLSKIYDFSDVDWQKCYKKSLMSDVFMVADLWNKGNRVMEICSIAGLGKGTVRRYLMRASDIKLCSYDHTKSNHVKVLCRETGEIFDSLRQAEIKYGIKRGYISAYLKGRTTLPVGNMSWEYVDENKEVV